MWAGFNGVTEWIDHRKTRQTSNQRLASVWFGSQQKRSVRGFEQIFGIETSEISMIKEQWLRDLSKQGLNVSFLQVPCDLKDILKAVETALKIPGVKIEKSKYTAPLGE